SGPLLWATSAALADSIRCSCPIMESRPVSSRLVLWPSLQTPVPCLVANAPAAACALPIDDKAVKALEAWLKVYQTGKIEFGSRRDIGKESIAEKFGLMPKGIVGTITPQRDLEIILEQVVKIDSAAAAEAVLEVAAIGLDKSRFDYKAHMAPFD